MNEESRIETLSSPFGRPLRRSFVRRLWLFYLPATFLLLLCLELIFLAFIWPDWEAWRAGKIPASALIENYKEQQASDPRTPPLRWTPVAKPFPRQVRRVFVLAEDSRFYEHSGIDLEAILQAVDYNFRHGRILLGASTISQQTAKNMFLSLSRSPLRKWHELLLTFLLESQLSKDEILQVYLNVAEFGPGIFGLEAAARYYFKTSAQGLGPAEALELAASLPSPRKNNPKTRTLAFQKRVQRIGQTLQVVDRVAAEPSRSSSQRRALEQSLEELRRELKVEAPESVSPPLPLPLPPPDQDQENPEGAPKAQEAEALSPELEAAPPPEPAPPEPDADPKEDPSP